jgi:hypothetical protein
MFDDIIGPKKPTVQRGPVLHDNIEEVIQDALNNSSVTPQNMPTAIDVIKRYMDKVYGEGWDDYYYIKITYDNDTGKYSVEVLNT